MPRYNIKREGYMVIIEGYRIVTSGECKRMNHEIRFERSGLSTAEMKSRDLIIAEFIDKMRGKEYTPQGPTVYCLDCQEQCQHKGMEEG
jgi:hypothetical protein